MAERTSLADLKDELKRTRPVPRAPKLAAAPGNLTRAEVVPDRGRLPSPVEAPARVQKNLRILKSDNDRMVRYARAARISQTVLLSLALDAYEAQLEPANEQ